MKYLIIFIITATLGLFGCQKKDTTTPDVAKVTFNITSPQPAHVYRTGDSVHINATVTYPSELHGYELRITDTTTGYIVYDNAQHVHSDHFDINETWATSGNSAQILKLELITDIDHNGTEAKTTVFFSYMP